MSKSYELQIKAISEILQYTISIFSNIQIQFKLLKRIVQNYPYNLVNFTKQSSRLILISCFRLSVMSFNDFKNNTQILKKYLMRMNSITQTQIKPQWIQQNFLKQNNPHIFLQILHYVIINFSPSVLFVKVLDLYPTIKDDNDKKFVTNTLSLGRKMFQIDVKIDIDQFLSGKFVQKKTEFTSSFCKAAYEFYLKQTKPILNSKIGVMGVKKENQSITKVPNSTLNKQTIQEDQDQQNPRNLNIVPSNPRRPIIKKQDMKSSSEDEDLKELINKKKQLTKFKDKTSKHQFTSKTFTQNVPSIDQRKQNVFPKNIQKFSQDQDDLNQAERQIKQIKKMNNYNVNSQKGKSEQHLTNKHKINKNLVESPRLEQIDPNDNDFGPADYVTREEFMQIVTGMTKNFTQLLNKFNDFQRQVTGWVQNVNAKVSILQENVKTIKNNI